MKEALLDRRGDVDELDWLVMARHYARNGEEEQAFQAYYMAHLLNHGKIGANASLAFETQMAAPAEAVQDVEEKAPNKQITSAPI